MYHASDQELVFLIYVSSGFALMMLDSFFPFFTFILIDELLTLRVNKWDKGF